MHKKKFGAVGAMAPTPLSLKTWGGGGQGCCMQGPGPASPPPVGWYQILSQPKAPYALTTKAGIVETATPPICADYGD